MESEYDKLKVEHNLLKQLYDGAIMQFKEADRQAHDLDILVTAKQNEITRLHNVCHEYTAEINVKKSVINNLDTMINDFTAEVLDLRKQVTLKELSNAALTLENRRIIEALFQGAFRFWLHDNNWFLHSSGEYYYRSKDFHQWPPDEAREVEDLKAEFKSKHNV